MKKLKIKNNYSVFFNKLLSVPSLIIIVSCILAFFTSNDIKKHNEEKRKELITQEIVKQEIKEEINKEKIENKKKIKKTNSKRKKRKNTSLVK